MDIEIRNILAFRLHAHHLDREYGEKDAVSAAGACGLQNSPPGAWETSLHNRVPGMSRAEMERILEKEKLLVQAWSFRGAPVVFPREEAAAFLQALIPEGEEPWIYTDGIRLALDFLGMSFSDLLDRLLQVISGLDDRVIVSKSALDQTLAEWMLPLIPEEKRRLWNAPSMYGQPERQTVGGAVVSFLLRPCSFLGRVVFGERQGIYPAFTSYKHWIRTSGIMEGNPAEAQRQLVRKYLHCYGPSDAAGFASWLGCSGKQARRLWAMVSEEMEPVRALGKKKYILTRDRELLLGDLSCGRTLHLLGAHDPYLDLRDRELVRPEPELRRRIWRTVGNPGVILYCGRAVGIWTARKTGKGLQVKTELWEERSPGGDLFNREICDLAEQYAAFWQERLYF